jgi:hypothetical protein
MGPFFKGWIPADFHKTQIAHSTQLEGSNPQSEGAYGKSVFSPPDPGTAPPENRKPEMGWFSKGWKTDFPSRGFRAFEKRADFRTCGNGPVFQRLDSGGFPQNSNRSFDDKNQKLEKPGNTETQMCNAASLNRSLDSLRMA